MLKNIKSVKQVDGDVRWELYSGTFLVERKDGSKELWHIDASDDEEPVLTLYRTSLEQDPIDYYDRADWNGIARYAGIVDLTEASNFELTIAYADYNGWSYLDGYPQKTTEKEIQDLLGID